ncbi:MAG: cell division protein ZapA [Candidatus Cloacimonetes bacterium]|nr:cell division protein ZapA [Candidatus Cloacimonadota bacterium]MBL7149576.1 cell division protein ZapA [Candidatus Cloacimonadota bacterium]
MKSIEIELLGRKYFFRSDNPEKLQETARYLESQLEELNSRFNTVDQNKLFVLYALMITEKYLSTIENNKELNKEFEQITNMLNNQVLENEA